MAEAAVPGELFAAISERIQRFGVPPTPVQPARRGDQTNTSRLPGQGLVLRGDDPRRPFRWRERPNQRLGGPGGWLAGYKQGLIGGFRWNRVARLGMMAA